MPEPVPGPAQRTGGLPDRPPRRRPSPAWLCVALIGLVLAPAAPGTEAPAAATACAAVATTAGGGVGPGCLRRLYTRPASQWPAPHVDPGAAWQELAPLPANAPEPAHNPGTPEKVALGKRLFEDPRLSRSGQIACASCHERQLGWADGRRLSFGHDRQPGRRNAPGVAMSAYAQPLFWDGRAPTLEAQAAHSIEDPKEMAFSIPGLEQRLQQESGYPAAFSEVFGSPGVSGERIGQALAAYQRTLVPRNSRFDRFLKGDGKALNDQQLHGLHLFRTRARCMNCHSGPALTDNRFHNLGLHFHGRRLQDLGRYEVTGDPVDSGRFRTPSLRGVSRTAPYMHNGLFPHLRGVLNMYNAGMPRPRPPETPDPDAPFPQDEPLLQPLQLTAAEIEAVVAFLETL